MTAPSPDIESQLSSLSPKEKVIARHVLSAVASPLYWMQNCTRTIDEQSPDPNNRVRPFPNRGYFDDLWLAWQKESVLLTEKSRTMMASWTMAGFATWSAMTSGGTRVLFMAQDEERSLIPLNYCWTLWENQDEIFRRMWPLDRPRKNQQYNVMELKNGSCLSALPGKDPAKIRGYHPSIVIFDEAADIEDFGEAFDIAVATRVPKIVAISSANISEYEELIKVAEPVDWYEAVA